MNKLTTVQQEMVEENYGMIWHYYDSVIRQEKFPKYLRTDLKSDLQLSFCNSVSKFDKSKGFKLSTFVYTNFKYCVMNILNRTHEGNTRYCYLEDKDERYLKLRNSPDREKIFDSDEIFYLLCETDLTDRERDMVETHFFKEMTYRNMAVIYKVSYGTCQNVVFRAISKIKKEANKLGITIEDFYN